MIDKVTQALKAKHDPPTLDSIGIKIPSQSSVGLQFAPKNKNTTKALAYAGMCRVGKIVAFDDTRSFVVGVAYISVIVMWHLLGMLGLVHMVQQRTLRSHHEDAHYCAKNYKNLRHYDVLLKHKLIEVGSDAVVAFVSSDDKAKVCVAFKVCYRISM